MNRWANYLLQALASLAEDDHGPFYPMAEPVPERPFTVDLDDDASVRAAFRWMVEREWGPAAFGGESSR